MVEMEELVPVTKSMAERPAQAPGAALPLPGVSRSEWCPPPMEPGKNVEFAAYQDNRRRLTVYRSREAGSTKEDIPMGNRRGGLNLLGVLGWIFQNALVLIVGGALIAIFWSVTHMKTVRCDVCGKTLTSWQDVTFKPTYSNIFSRIGASIGDTSVLQNAEVELCDEDYLRLMMYLDDLQKERGGKTGNGEE